MKLPLQGCKEEEKEKEKKFPLRKPGKQERKRRQGVVIFSWLPGFLSGLLFGKRSRCGEGH
jgi:hypothetical protein